MNKSKILTTLLVAFCSSPVSAETLKAGYPVCITHDLLDQAYAAIVNSDLDSLQWLSNHGCAVSVEGTRVSVLESVGWAGTLRLRAYKGKHAVEIWASREAIATE